MLRKYWTVFQLSFQNEFVYRLNFVLWRLRNLIRFLLTYFLWNRIYLERASAFGYSRGQMMAYVFFVLIISSLVTTTLSNDNIGGEISNGDLSNYLLKPIGYLRYWLTRDWANKVMNTFFALFELSALWFILKPSISISSSPIQFILGLLAIILAAVLFYIVTKIFISVSFWTPENTWGLMFIFLVFLESLSGMLFPLNILPHNISSLLDLTPFPYLIYYPNLILTGKISFLISLGIVAKTIIWLGIAYWLLMKIWRSGLKTYSAAGR